MHVRYTTKLTRILMAAGFFRVFLMVSLTMGDYLARAGVGLR